MDSTMGSRMDSFVCRWRALLRMRECVWRGSRRFPHRRLAPAGRNPVHAPAEPSHRGALLPPADLLKPEPSSSGDWAGRSDGSARFHKPSATREPNPSRRHPAEVGAALNGLFDSWHFQCWSMSHAPVATSALTRAVGGAAGWKGFVVRHPLFLQIYPVASCGDYISLRHCLFTEKK